MSSGFKEVIDLQDIETICLGLVFYLGLDTRSCLDPILSFSEQDLSCELLLILLTHHGLPNKSLYLTHCGFYMLGWLKPKTI